MVATTAAVGLVWNERWLLVTFRRGMVPDTAASYTGFENRASEWQGLAELDHIYQGRAQAEARGWPQKSCIPLGRLTRITSLNTVS